MPEHQNSEEFNVLRCPELQLLLLLLRIIIIVILPWRSVGLVGGGEDDKAVFPNGRPFYVLASREDSE
jgi:hypothetical protein